MTMSETSPAPTPEVETAAAPEDLVVQSVGLGKDYGSIRAVESVDITVRRGEFFGFLGPNGAGKTTMIHMLTTLVRPSRGSATVAGHDVVARPLAVRENIGLVFQETSLDPELSAEENLRLAGRLYGLTGADLRHRIDEVLELFGLEARRHDHVRTFSGGMRRLVDLARGILHRPAVLFLDEPTLGLDPANRQRVWGFLERLAREEQMTLFLTTHYLEEAEPCDRVVIVDRGRIIAQGTPADLKKDLGGQESIELAVRNPGRELLADIERRTGAQPRVAGDAVVLSVDSAETVLPGLLPLIGSGIDSLSVRRPTLDDVFIAVTASGEATAP
jgi:ABC-2 type transport system ATP-binding protein